MLDRATNRFSGCASSHRSASAALSLPSNRSVISNTSR
jgi:hypothetical protein